MNNFTITLPGMKYLEEYLEMTELKRIIIGNNKYSIRMSTDYSFDEMKIIIDKARTHNTEIYIAFNKIFHEKEVDKMIDLLDEIISLNPHGIIFSDFGVYEQITEKGKNIKLLFNTDTTVTNNSYTELAKELGIDAVEVAKEITLDDIKEVNANKLVPIQVMIHGHLYMYHSYRKLVNTYSQHLKKKINSKKKLFLYDDERNLKYPIVQNESGTHILSAYDLAMISKMDKIFALNLDYLKIDSFGYAEDDFYDLVISYISSYRDFLNLSDTKEFKLNNKYRFEKIKQNNSNKKFSTGFMFKKSIY